MSAHPRVTPKQKVDIIEAYTTNLTPVIQLAKQYGICRQAIYKILKRADVDTTKHKLPVSCTVCSKEIHRHKARIRHQLNHFCSTGCYHAFITAGHGNGPYIPWRHGMRIARQKVSEYFNLQPGHVCHHEDRNCYNNRLDNLRVFANNGDHIRYHRGFDVGPVWDGSSL